MTRTVEDMLAILDVLTATDSTTDGDFWREQQYVPVPEVKRPSSYLSSIDNAQSSLRGKRIAVPKMYIGGHDPKAKPTVISDQMLDLWKRARSDLENLGATVVDSDFPLVTNYEDDSVSGHANNVVGFKPDWNGKERGELVAYLWDDFLKANADPNYPDMASVDGTAMFPRPPDYIPDRYMERKNFMDYPGLVETARQRDGKSIWEIDGIAEALPALEAQRKRDLEEWMDHHGYDVVVFPANGDVGRADVDTNDDSARHALQNGVKYSNGNRATRHMGVPTVSVTMGLMAGSRMPVNLTFAGKHGQDTELLRYASAFEQHGSGRRFPPPVTPALLSDRVSARPTAITKRGIGEPPQLACIVGTRIGNYKLRVAGSVTTPPQGHAQIEAWVDGQPVSDITINEAGEWSFEAGFTPFEPPKPLYGGVGLVVGKVMVVILARSAGAVTGQLVLVDQKEPISTV